MKLRISTYEIKEVIITPYFGCFPLLAITKTRSQPPNTKFFEPHKGQAPRPT